MLGREPDPYRLVDHISGGHDHQEVDVAVRVGRAVGVRAEEDDLLRLEPLGDLARELADRAEGNSRCAGCSLGGDWGRFRAMRTSLSVVRY